MVWFLKTSSRVVLIIAILVLSLRPSAVNCQKPIFVHSAMRISQTTGVCADSSAQHISRRCSFIKVEPQSDLKFFSKNIFLNTDHFFDTFTSRAPSFLAEPYVYSPASRLLLRI